MAIATQILACVLVLGRDCASCCSADARLIVGAEGLVPWLGPTPATQATAFRTGRQQQAHGRATCGAGMLACRHGPTMTDGLAPRLIADVWDTVLPGSRPTARQGREMLLAPYGPIPIAWPRQELVRLVPGPCHEEECCWKADERDANRSSGTCVTGISAVPRSACPRRKPGARQATSERRRLYETPATSRASCWNTATAASSSATGTNSPGRCARPMSPGPITTQGASACSCEASVPKAATPAG